MKMKKCLFCYIVYILTIFNSFAAANEKTMLPDDFSGAFTLQYISESQSENGSELSAQGYGMILWEIGQYFYQKYPDENIFYQDDFINELKPFFPTDTDDDLHGKAALLRNIIAAYNAGRDIYNDFIKKTLVPHIYKAVHNETEFDKTGEVSYIEADDDEFIKVYNFKKFLSYANNQDEIKAIEDFKKASQKDASFFDKMNYALNKIEWKKIPFYGYKYKNPLFSEESISELISGKNVSLQIISRKNYIDGQKELIAAIHFLTDERHFILANNAAEDLPKLNIDLSDSENIEDYKILYPVPFSSRSVPAWHKYFGDFLVPIKITLKDVNKPLKINAKITATLCNALQYCEVQNFMPELEIKPSGEEIFENGFDNFFAVSLAQNPLEKPQKLTLKKFVVDNDYAGQSLRLEFAADENVHHFQVYVEEKDGYTLFAAPLISISDNRIFVRFLPQKPLKYNLIDSLFIISANLNNHQFLRQELFAKLPSEFDIDKPTLNLGLIIIAVIGGLILNFMPCVFPVLSFKITAISHALYNTKQLRRSLGLTILGILCGFTLIIGILLIAKTIGYALGWGMQYQQMSFLVVMLFMVVYFAISANSWQLTANIMPDMHSKSCIKDILYGTLIVLLATPCTGPYLATVVGFALSGSRTDIIIILYAVAIGLCLPYFMVLCLKNPQTLFPKPGAWMQKLNIFARILIWLTAVWFISLIYRQTSTGYIWKLVLILLCFILLLKVYFRYMAYLDERIETEIPSEIELSARKNGKYVVLVVTALLSAVAIYTAQNAYNENYAQNLAERQTTVNTNLIKEKLNAGRSVLLEISADWCLTCHYNNAVVFTKKNLDYWHERYHLDLIKADWTNYNEETLQYMARYGRKGLPFYIIYTPLMREGMVLPEIFEANDIEQILSY